MPICPLMSYAANQVQCAREQCALWDKREEACGLITQGGHIKDSVEHLTYAINEIKVKF